MAMFFKQFLSLSWVLSKLKYFCGKNNEIKANAFLNLTVFPSGKDTLYLDSISREKAGGNRAKDKIVFTRSLGSHILFQSMNNL